MSRGLFIAGTGTGVGKTYVSALLVKSFMAEGLKAGYYKGALSGVSEIGETDCDYVCRVGGLKKGANALVSYAFKTPVSPHLASKLEGKPIQFEKMVADFETLKSKIDYLTIEGSGGVFSPLNLETGPFFLMDLVKALKLKVLLVADSAVGAINATVLTTTYLKNIGVGILGIVLNNYDHNQLAHRDNKVVIEQLSGIKVVAALKKGENEWPMAVDTLKKLYGEV